MLKRFAHWRGRRAAERGLGLDANPYPKSHGRYLRAAWRRGWLSTEAGADLVRDIVNESENHGSRGQS